MNIVTILIILICASGQGQKGPMGEPVLYKKLGIPRELLTISVDEDGNMQTFGGDVRIGDLDGDGAVDFLVFRNIDGTKPVFLGAFRLNGEVLWRVGEGGGQPVRPGPAAIHDIDADGECEVICFFHKPDVKSKADELKDMIVQIRDGRTGEVEKETAPPELTSRSGKGPNWVHQRILIANFRGTRTPRDVVVKLGDTLLALDENLQVLWTYRVRWNEYSRCSAYIPAVGDIDGDGKDEVNGGYFLLGPDGTPKWEKQLGRNMDSVAITEWDDGRIRAICSGFGHVMDDKGNVILKLGKPVGPARMGWYHCIPANVCQDEREELVLYNPWDRWIYIYTPSPLRPQAFEGYRATPRQYNARLMD